MQNSTYPVQVTGRREMCLDVLGRNMKYTRYPYSNSNAEIAYVGTGSSLKCQVFYGMYTILVWGLDFHRQSRYFYVSHTYILFVRMNIYMIWPLVHHSETSRDRINHFGTKTPETYVVDVFISPENNWFWLLVLCWCWVTTNVSSCCLYNMSHYLVPGARYVVRATPRSVVY